MALDYMWLRRSERTLAEPYQIPPCPEVLYKAPQEDSALLLLPREILEIIRSYLDGKSLVRLSCTCCLFYNLINEETQWEKCVQFESQPTQTIMDLSLHFSTPFQQLLPSHETPRELGSLDYPWKQIYYCSQMLNLIHKADYSLAFTEDVTMDEITSVDIAGQDILFGTCKGGLGVWDPDSNRRLVDAIPLSPVAIDQIFAALPENLRAEECHYKIIIHFADSSLMVLDMNGNLIYNSEPKARDLSKISNHGGKLFEWDPARGTAAITRIGSDEVERVCDYKYHQVPFGPFVAIDIFEELFISQTCGPYLMEFDKKTSQLCPNQLLSNIDTLSIYKAYIWPGKISLSLTVARQTIISVGEKSTVITWPPTFKCVSASLVANVLIVGTNVGTILFYPFKDPTDLLKLDPKLYQQKLRIGCSRCILFVGVRVQNGNHRLPDIVVATQSKLYCFRANGFMS